MANAYGITDDEMVLLYQGQDTRKGWFSVPHQITDERALEIAAAYGYAAIIVGSERAIVGVHDFLTTRGLIFPDLRPTGGIIRRYCYQNRIEADTALLMYQDPKLHPWGNWIKHKGFFNGKGVDDLNPDWSNS